MLRGRPNHSGLQPVNRRRDKVALQQLVTVVEVPRVAHRTVVTGGNGKPPHGRPLRNQSPVPVMNGMPSFVVFGDLEDLE